MNWTSIVHINWIEHDMVINWIDHFNSKKNINRALSFAKQKPNHLITIFRVVVQCIEWKPEKNICTYISVFSQINSTIISTHVNADDWKCAFWIKVAEPYHLDNEFDIYIYFSIEKVRGIEFQNIKLKMENLNRSWVLATWTAAFSSNWQKSIGAQWKFPHLHWIKNREREKERERDVCYQLATDNTTCQQMTHWAIHIIPITFHLFN